MEPSAVAVIGSMADGYERYATGTKAAVNDIFAVRFKILVG